MTRRRRSVLLVVAGVGLVLGVAPYVFFHPRRLNHDGFAAVRDGMTQQEVEQLLGGPPGIYYPSYLGTGAGGSDEFVLPTAGQPLWANEWYDDRAQYGIWFNDQGLVAGKHKRAHWYTTTYTCRLTGWLFGRSEPIPLEPRRYAPLPPR